MFINWSCSNIAPEMDKLQDEINRYVKGDNINIDIIKKYKINIYLKKLLLSQYSDERSFIMAKYKVDISGVNTSSLKVLSNEENLELFKKMQEGDSFARDDLINGNLKLVLAILKNLIIK